MVPAISDQVKILSACFLFIFFGFGAVQTYMMPFFSDYGLIDVGFRSLILIYLFFMISDPLSAIFISKYGAKKCMIFGTIFYFLFLISLLSKSFAAIYIASALLGIGASFLWTGQNTYLIRASSKKYYGESAGFFNMVYMAGGGAGVLVLSFMLSISSYESSFLLFSIFPIIGLLLLFRLADIRTQKKQDHIRLIKKSLSSRTALKLSILWFVISFCSGLTRGIIPLQINTILGISFVGILFSLFSIAPIFLSFFFGKLSDKVGRNKIIAAAYILQLAALLLLYFQNKIMLVLGIILFALSSAIMRPVTYALVGDVSTGKNLEYLAALFWTIENAGIVLALIFSQLLVSRIDIIYLISISSVVVSSFFLLPLFRMNAGKIRDRISKEMD